MRRCPYLVAAGSAGFVDEVFAPQLSQVVAGLADGAAAAQLGDVVRDRLEPQHALAFGIGLTGQAPEVELEHGQVIGRCLDRGLDNLGGGQSVALGGGRWVPQSCR